MSTKEQHDLLFSKMKDTGYVWDEEKKELRKIEKQARSITITIPEELKGTDTDGGVVGERGEQGEPFTDKNFKERYNNIAKSDWFKKTHNGMSVPVGDDEEPKWTEEDSLMIDSIIYTMKWLEGKGTTDMKIDWLIQLKQRML